MSPEQSREAKKAVRAWARKQPGIRCTEQYVLEKLALFADPETQSCWPSAARIGGMVNLSDRQVLTIFKALQKWGLITFKKRRRDGIEWQLNTGVVIGKDQRPPQAKVGARGRKALPVLVAGDSGEPTPQPEARSGPQDRKSVPVRAEGASGHPGSQFRSRAEGPSDKGKGQGKAGTLKREAAPLDTDTAWDGAERRRWPRPTDRHQPPSHRGELRSQGRTATAYTFPVRDQAYDGGGVVNTPGLFALTDDQLWAFRRQFAVLDSSGVDVKAVLYKARERMEGYAAKDDGLFSRKLRAKLLEHLAVVWLSRDQDPLLKKAGGKGQQKMGVA